MSCRHCFCEIAPRRYSFLPSERTLFTSDLTRCHHSHRLQVQRRPQILNPRFCSTCPPSPRIQQLQTPVICPDHMLQMSCHMSMTPPRYLTNPHQITRILFPMIISKSKQQDNIMGDCRYAGSLYSCTPWGMSPPSSSPSP